MAHMAKYTRAAMGHMANHYARSDLEGDATYVPRKNENIDTARTHMNFNLAKTDQPLGQLEFLHKRLSEVRVHRRADVNVMVDWVVTLPKSIQPESDDMVRFFSVAYDFLGNRYGKENTISAYVHMDEKTPHMHFSFVPVVVDVKHDGFKLSAKEAVTREDLRTFHSDLGDYMKQVFGRDIGIENEATKDGNKSIAELKRGTAQKQLAEYKKRLKAYKDEYGAVSRQREWISNLSPEKGITGAVKGVTVEQIEKLKRIATNALDVKLRVILDDLDSQKLREENARLKKSKSSVVGHLQKIEEEKRLRKIEAAFNSLPQEMREKALRDQEQKVQDRAKAKGQER